jgi:hypothetical protein
MVSQPLVSIGQIVAQTVVDQIERRGEHMPGIAMEPEFVVRKSMGPDGGARLGRLAEAHNTRGEGHSSDTIVLWKKPLLHGEADSLEGATPTCQLPRRW